jgi:hypothetical protein
MDTHNAQMERDRAAAKEASDKLEDARTQLEEEHTRPALDVHKQLVSARQEQAELQRSEARRATEQEAQQNHEAEVNMRQQLEIRRNSEEAERRRAQATEDEITSRLQEEREARYLAERKLEDTHRATDQRIEEERLAVARQAAGLDRRETEFRAAARGLHEAEQAREGGN